MIEFNNNPKSINQSPGSGGATQEQLEAILQDYPTINVLKNAAIGISDSLLSEAERELLVWNDEFLNGQFDPQKWSKVTYKSPSTNLDNSATVEDGNYKFTSSSVSNNRMVSRQSFRDCTIRIRAKNLSFWVGTQLFGNSNIPGDGFLYEEIDFCEKYDHDDNYVWCNTHSRKIDTTHNKSNSETTSARISNHNFYADDEYHIMEMDISAANAEGVITVVYKLDGSTISTQHITRQHITDTYAEYDHEIARTGVHIVLDRALGDNYNNSRYSNPVVDYVRVFAHNRVSYPVAIGLGGIANKGGIASLNSKAVGGYWYEMMSTDAILTLPAEYFTYLESMLSANEASLAKAIMNNDVYKLDNATKQDFSKWGLAPRLIAFPLESPVIPEFKYIDTRRLLTNLEKNAVIKDVFADGDIRTVDPGWTLNDYDIKEVTFEWGGDVYRTITINSFSTKINWKPDWTETNSGEDTFIQNKPS